MVKERSKTISVLYFFTDIISYSLFSGVKFVISVVTHIEYNVRNLYNRIHNEQGNVARYRKKSNKTKL